MPDFETEPIDVEDSSTFVSREKTWSCLHIETKQLTHICIRSMVFVDQISVTQFHVSPAIGVLSTPMTLNKSEREIEHGLICGISQQC